MKNSIKILFLIMMVIYLPFRLIAQTGLSNVNLLLKIKNNSTVNYPVTGMPFGMHYWAPQALNTNDIRTSNKITGFRQTHQINSGSDDYGAFLLMPTSDTLIVDRDGRAATFQAYNQKIYPHHYRVRFDNGITTEIVPTERAAIMRLKYAYGGKSYLLLDLLKGKGKVEIMPTERKIVGYCTNNNGKQPANFANYFVIKFLRQFDDYGSINNGLIKTKQLVDEGNNVGAWLMFDLKTNEVVTIQVASSFVSVEQAERNLAQELNHKTFETAKQQAQKIWDDALSKVTVEGGNKNEQELFYTVLYYMLLYPQIQYEVDPSGNPVYYSFDDGKLYNDYMFSPNVFQPAYQKVKPLLKIFYPELTAKINKVEKPLIKAFTNPPIDTTNVLEKAYLGNFDMNKSWEVQKLMPDLLRAYTSEPDMSIESVAWYVYSSIGLYPVDTLFVFGNPLFNKTTFNLPAGKAFTISTANKFIHNPYIGDVKLDTVNYSKNYILYSNILGNDRLEFIYQESPNFLRNINTTDIPYYVAPKIVKKLPKKTPAKSKIKKTK